MLVSTVRLHILNFLKLADGAGGQPLEPLAQVAVV